MLSRFPPRTSPATTSVFRPSRPEGSAAVRPAMPPPAMTMSNSLAVGKTSLAGLQHFVGVAFPPVELREDLHLLESGVPGRLHPAPDARQIDHAVAHHPSVVEEIARRHQPVAD